MALLLAAVLPSALCPHPGPFPQFSLAPCCFLVTPAATARASPSTSFHRPRTYCLTSYLDYLLSSHHTHTLLLLPPPSLSLSPPSSCPSHSIINFDNHRSFWHSSRDPDPSVCFFPHSISRCAPVARPVALHARIHTIRALIRLEHQDPLAPTPPPLLLYHHHYRHPSTASSASLFSSPRSVHVDCLHHHQPSLLCFVTLPPHITRDHTVKSLLSQRHLFIRVLPLGPKLATHYYQLQQRARTRYTPAVYLLKQRAYQSLALG